MKNSNAHKTGQTNVELSKKDSFLNQKIRGTKPLNSEAFSGST